MKMVRRLCPILSLASVVSSDFTGLLEDVQETSELLFFLLLR